MNSFIKNRHVRRYESLIAALRAGLFRLALLVAHNYLVCPFLAWPSSDVLMEYGDISLRQETSLKSNARYTNMQQS